ncbi:MAG: helix-turn-helix domain-containing protein [Burkholderiales bacterium]|nr:helix-turn-helix domain-containing protein [Burkholderiales bacterium]
MRKDGPLLPPAGEPRLSGKDFVSALQKGLEVLTCFHREAARLTLSDVARRTGSTPASARRSLHTLHALGYLERDGRYFRVAPRALLVAHAFLASRPTPQLAQPHLDGLAERTRESATLGQWLDDDVVIVARSTARRSLSTGLGIGSRLPGYCSSLGRVLLASLPPAEARRRVERMDRVPLTARTAWRTPAVLALVDRCRELGWAESDGELELDVRSLAVPVFDREGSAVGAMSMAVRAERMTMAEFRTACLPVLRRARDALATQLPPECR